MANADLAEYGPFLRKAFSHTVAVIYCIGSLPNGAAGEERIGKEKGVGRGQRRTQKRMVKVIGKEK